MNYKIKILTLATALYGCKENNELQFKNPTKQNKQKIESTSEIKQNRSKKKILVVNKTSEAQKEAEIKENEEKERQRLKKQVEANKKKEEERLENEKRIEEERSKEKIEAERKKLEEEQKRLEEIKKIELERKNICEKEEENNKRLLVGILNSNSSIKQKISNMLDVISDKNNSEDQFLDFESAADNSTFKYLWDELIDKIILIFKNGNTEILRIRSIFNNVSKLLKEDDDNNEGNKKNIEKYSNFIKELFFFLKSFKKK